MKEKNKDVSEKKKKENSCQLYDSSLLKSL